MNFYWKKRKIGLWLLIVALLIIGHFIGLLNPFERALTIVFEPLGSKLYSIGNGFRSSYSQRLSYTDLSKQYQESQTEIAALTVENSHLKDLEAENQKLREQLNFFATNSYRQVAANVISQDALFNIQEGEQNIVIDKGLKNGVNIGYGVVNQNGILVGRVVDVKDDVAKVCLTTNSNCKFTATIQNQTRTMGVTEGDLGLTIKMNYIPQSENITPGDTVVTSGLGGNIPRGLVIGKVVQVDNKSNEIWQDVNIEPLSDTNDLTIVSVLIP